MHPRVTVAMPVLNGENYIGTAIASILAQTFSDLELVITDNASTDATEDICRKFARQDPRVIYCRNAQNIGAARNYERGWHLARGAYLKWAAHDDLVSSAYIERCVEVLEARSDVALAFGRTQCIDKNGAAIPWSADKVMKSVDIDDPAERLYAAVTKAGNCFPIFGLFRCSVLARSTLHRPYYGSDRALIAEVALLGKVVEVGGDAIFYNRDHRSRSINMAQKAERARWQNARASRLRAMEHLNLLAHLLEIACRHPEVVPPRRALVQVARYAMQARQLHHYKRDVARLIFPSLMARRNRQIVRANQLVPNSEKELKR